jgi:excisionase family DNA binding protein
LGAEDRVLNVEQVRKKLGCCRSHVYNLISMGEIQAFRIGNRKGIRVKSSSVEAFLETREKSEV